MGRRSRARERAETPARAASPAPAARPARAGRRGRRLLRLLNPFKLGPPSRSRAGWGAAGFGLSAALFAAVGWLTREPAWFNSAVLLAVLALAWGLRAAFMGRDERTR
jgi:hypothetical protein